MNEQELEQKDKQRWDAIEQSINDRFSVLEEMYSEQSNHMVNIQKKLDEMDSRINQKFDDNTGKFDITDY